MNVNIKNTRWSGDREGRVELAGLFDGLEKGDVLFSLMKFRAATRHREYLYPAMEDYRWTSIIDLDQGTQSAALIAEVHMVGATYRAGHGQRAAFVSFR